MRLADTYLPQYALTLIDVLESAGHETWVVGGWVRDALLDRVSHDIDMACSARWPQTEEALRQAGIAVYRTGVAHGTLTAVIDGHPVEITTYRTEGVYSDNRHPDEVVFVDSIALDMARRDFTVNAMAFHPDRGLFDLFGGLSDIENHSIRAVGNPDVRFTEDALRILRAVRFAARLGFSIEDDTGRAMSAHASLLDHISRERIGHEMSALVASGHMGWALRTQAKVIAAALPALAPMINFDQKSPYHCYDVLNHTAAVCDGVEKFTGSHTSSALRWAALLHDVAKPACASFDVDGRGHFFTHAEKSAKIAQNLMWDLALPHELIDQTCALITVHDSEDLRPLAYRCSDKKAYEIVARMLQTLAKARAFDPKRAILEVLVLMRADALAKDVPCWSYVADIDVIERRVRSLLYKGVCWQKSDLAISGRDIMNILQIREGRAVGFYLDVLHHAVIVGDVDNTYEALAGELERYKGQDKAT